MRIIPRHVIDLSRLCTTAHCVKVFQAKNDSGATPALACMVPSRGEKERKGKKKALPRIGRVVLLSVTGCIRGVFKTKTKNKTKCAQSTDRRLSFAVQSWDTEL